MTMNDIKAGDVLVRPGCKQTVISVREEENGKLCIVVYDPPSRHNVEQIVPAERRAVQIPAGLVERS